MKALVIFAHPDVENGSIGNKVILDELKKVEQLEIRELYKLYPDFNIDVAAEQEALRQADIIVFQFPFYWYSCPALLKKWLDDVFLYGFAYGSTGKELHGKELLMSFTIGGAAESYRPDGYNIYPIDDFMTPFKQTANLTGLTFLENYVYSHGVVNIPGVNYPKEASIAIAHKHVDRLTEILTSKMADQEVKTTIVEHKQPVYFIGQVDVKDFEAYMTEYGMPVVGQLIEHGVEILSGTPDSQLLEGEWPECWNVLFKFPSQTVFDDFWHGDAYAPFKKLRREKLTHGGNVVVLPGFDPDSLT